jgi:hypothetical protein
LMPARRRSRDINALSAFYGHHGRRGDGRPAGGRQKSPSWPEPWPPPFTLSAVSLSDRSLSAATATIPIVFGVEDLDLQPEDAGGFLHLPHFPQSARQHGPWAPAHVGVPAARRSRPGGKPVALPPGRARLATRPSLSSCKSLHPFNRRTAVALFLIGTATLLASCLPSSTRWRLHRRPATFHRMSTLR